VCLSRKARHNHEEGHVACSVSDRLGYEHLSQSCIMMTNVTFVLFHSLLTDVSKVNVVKLDIHISEIKKVNAPRTILKKEQHDDLIQ
jgi:hypothetical protein